MKNLKRIYLASTGLLSAMMLLSAGMYFFNTAEVSQAISSLGYPTYIIYPLAVAKILGVLAFWFSKSNSLKEWAYAGFFFDFTLAFTGHLMVNDGEFAPSLVALILLLISYYSWKRLESS